ncbi:MAG: VOC family protein [Pricia sp.]
MKTINRLLTNICSADLTASKNFYTKLFDFKVDYDSDWFVHLMSKDKQLELGLMDRTHKLVPTAYQNPPNGFYITFVVDNVDELFETAKSEGFEIVEKPSDTFYGQRRLLLKDPDGSLVDVSSPIANP